MSEPLFASVDRDCRPDYHKIGYIVDTTGLAPGAARTAWAGDLDVVVSAPAPPGSPPAVRAGGSLAFAVIEAKSRTGGRAFTEWDSFGVPFDQGCHWLHSASINPSPRLPSAYGFTWRRAGRAAPA